MKNNIQEEFCSPEVEKHVIGAVLIEEGLAPVICNILRPQDFYIPEYSAIWDIITRFALDGKKFSIFDIGESAKVSGYKDLYGSLSDLLMEIRLEIVSSAECENHAKIILQYSQRRRTRDFLKRMQVAIENPTEDLEKTLLKIESEAVALRGGLESRSGLRVVPTEEWVKDALEAYDKTIYRGESTGWSNLDEIFKIGIGQVTGITGIPNHGKSEVLDALMLNLAMGSGWRIDYWSPENNPLQRHIQKLAEKTVGKYLYGERRMTFAEYHKALQDTISKHFRFLGQGQMGATFDQVLMEFGKMDPRPNACVIDPWNRLEIPNESSISETQYIRQCLVRAARFASVTGIHLFIVAHPQKLNKSKDGQIVKPTLYDISGSAHWYNCLDNGMLVWRDFKEKKTELHMLKVRFKDNGQPGAVTMKYEMSSGRYRPWTDADSFSEGTEPKEKWNKKTKPVNTQTAMGILGPQDSEPQEEEVIF